MTGQGGVVYHPELDDEIRAHPGGRVFLVRQLKAEADLANSAGDLKLKARDYSGANRLWSLAARYQRASQAIGYGKSTNPEDHPIIATSWRRTVQEITREKLEASK